MYDASFIEGNLREKSLYEIWNDPNAFSYNRQFKMEQLSGKCKTCDVRGKCAGGCRSYNYFLVTTCTNLHVVRNKIIYYATKR